MMPWHVEQGGGTCGSSEWAVINDDSGDTEGCHDSKGDAEAQMAALYANEPGANAMTKPEQRQAAAARRAERYTILREHAKRELRLMERVPCGTAWREPVYPAGKLRAKLHTKNGEQRYHVEGQATVFDQPYEMWDMFGPYEEFVAKGAADETLGNDPDVAFLVNHRGLTMARTASKTLELDADDEALNVDAWLNPKRNDVDNLMRAIEDKDITEMSFAFTIEAGWWSDDFMTFKIEKFDINRGDVSAVNYGANPYTSIAARSMEIMAELDKLPEAAAREAVRRLLDRDDVREDATLLNRLSTTVPSVKRNGPVAQPASHGVTLSRWEAKLYLLSED
jgi:HK97 family phage prohead protease